MSPSIGKALLIAVISFISWRSIQAKAQNHGTLPSKEYRGEGNIQDANDTKAGVLFKISYVHKVLDKVPQSTLVQQFDLSGMLLVQEDTTYDGQGRFATYDMTQRQTGDSARVESKGNQLFITSVSNGKTTRTTEAASSNTIAPGALMSFLQPQTDRILKGEKIPVQLAIAERARIFDFEIVGDQDFCTSSQGDLCVKVSLQNFLLNKLLNPIRMAFQKTPDGFLPLTIVTPALVRKRKGTSWEKFTARIDYQRIKN